MITVFELIAVVVVLRVFRVACVYVSTHRNRNGVLRFLNRVRAAIANEEAP